MKAQHRKELQTNALADRVNRMVEAAKAGPGRTTWVVAGVVVLALALYAGWRYYSDSAADKRTTLWLEVDEATTPEALDEIIQKSSNSIPGQVARLEQARLSYRQGIERLYSATDRGKAKADLQKAQELYDQVARESSNPPVMIQEALMGSAKARESLGEVDDAVAAYEKLAKDYPTSALGKEAEERAKQVRENETKIKGFYSELNKLADAKK
ncbi:MAG: tetratricopeptide repeat protein [Gemmataceae bacterium]